jgi:hypothetical protein
MLGESGALAAPFRAFLQRQRALKTAQPFLALLGVKF